MKSGQIIFGSEKKLDDCLADLANAGYGGSCIEYGAVMDGNGERRVIEFEKLNEFTFATFASIARDNGGYIILDIPMHYSIIQMFAGQVEEIVNKLDTFRDESNPYYQALTLDEQRVIDNAWTDLMDVVDSLTKLTEHLYCEAEREEMFIDIDNDIYAG